MSVGAQGVMPSQGPPDWCRLHRPGLTGLWNLAQAARSLCREAVEMWLQRRHVRASSHCAALRRYSSSPTAVRSGGGTVRSGSPLLHAIRTSLGTSGSYCLAWRIRGREGGSRSKASMSASGYGLLGRMSRGAIQQRMPLFSRVVQMASAKVLSAEEWHDEHVVSHHASFGCRSPQAVSHECARNGCLAAALLTSSRVTASSIMSLMSNPTDLRRHSRESIPPPPRVRSRKMARLWWGHQWPIMHRGLDRSAGSGVLRLPQLPCSTPPQALMVRPTFSTILCSSCP